jgi:colanic acid/amylovoran biosynthesis glycosyltransferase
MKIGYLMNSYPMTSTTFVRREIETLESMGVEVKRYAVRHWDQRLVDPLDIAESARTRYLLSGNIAKLVCFATIELFTNIRGVVSAFGPWRSQVRNGSGSAIKHVAYFLEAIMLRRLAKRDGIAHLHVHFSTNSAAVAMLSKLLGGPSYSFTAHGPDEFDDRTSGGLRLKIAHSAFVVAISKFCKATLIGLAGAEFSDKIHIVRCGVRVEDFVPDTAGFDGNETLVCVGRLCLQKGQLLLPSAVAALRSEFPGLRIILIGDGPIRTELEALISQHDLRGMIELRGWKPNVEVREAMGHARAFLLPSYAEGLPVVIMEALALGRPVISTKIAGIPELVDSGCGWIVVPGSEAELVQAIRSALRADSQQLRRLGTEGRRRIEEQHDIRKNARILLDLICAAM